MRGLIAGIDSGATSAYAVVSLEGKVIEVKSMKDGGLRFLFEGISRHGRPSFIAADTNPPSKAALHLKRSFHCRIYYPKKSLSTLDKDIICKDHKTTNAHERDALAAAIKAYNSVEGKLRQLRHRMRGRNVEARTAADFERIASRVLSGERANDMLNGKKSV